jgi:hypothetical protein
VLESARSNLLLYVKCLDTLNLVPFTKWGIDYTTCNPPLARGHHYIIIAIDYFTKWVEVMPTFKYDGETTTLFLFNQIIARFDVSREIFTDHGSHFQNKMMSELTSKLGLRQENLSPYYPQVNGQVEAVNKSLKTILQRMINLANSNWNLMFYSALWAYQTSIETATSFSPFQLIYGLEVVLPIECHIPSLNMVVQLFPDTSPLEECLLYLEKLDEQCRDASLANEAHKQKVKCQYDRSIHPRIFSKGDLVMVYDKDNYPLGVGKFKPMWFEPFIVKEFLKRGTYRLVVFEGNSLAEPRNGLYLKKYYS